MIIKLGIRELELAKACKIIYHVAKNATNDCYFIENPNCVRKLIQFLLKICKEFEK